MTEIKEEILMLETMLSENEESRKVASSDSERNRCTNRDVKLRRIKKRLEQVESTLLTVEPSLFP
jgi:hypothetical protein